MGWAASWYVGCALREPSGLHLFHPLSPEPWPSQTLTHCSLGTALNFPLSGSFPRVAELLGVCSTGCLSKPFPHLAADKEQPQWPYTHSRQYQEVCSMSSRLALSGCPLTQTHGVHRATAVTQSSRPVLPLPWNPDGFLLGS